MTGTQNVQVLDTMGLQGVFNYIVFDNPLSQGVTSVSKSVVGVSDPEYNDNFSI